MFTGIVTDLGEIVALRPEGSLRARISTAYDVDRLDIGASVSCDGVCLTVVAKGRDPRPWFEVQASAETLDKTNLAAWAPGRRINLERALKVGDELGGHIVSGHVDGTATVVSVRPEGDSTRVRLRAPEALAKFIAPQGLGRARRHLAHRQRGRGSRVRREPHPAHQAGDDLGDLARRPARQPRGRHHGALRRAPARLGLTP
jgi:hypothetical protein